MFLLSYDAKNEEEKKYIEFLKQQCLNDRICRELYEYAQKLMKK